MNILFLADPNSIHDQKWISYFSNDPSNKTFLLPRKRHVDSSAIKSFPLNSILLNPIIDFSMVRFYMTLVTAYRIKSIIKNNKIEIIHILYAEPNALWILFKFFFRVPMIISCRGTDVLKTIPASFSNRTLINRVVARAYRKSFLAASWVTCTSEKQIKSVISFSGRDKNLSVVRTGVDVKSINQTTATLPSQLKGTKFILFPRYIRPIYNHEFCLEAIDRLPSDIKQNYKMVFVGRDSGDPYYQATLEQKMKSIRDCQFVFLRKLSQVEIYSLYRGASLVVMTPKSDGSPVSAMETLLCGTPLILGPLAYDKEIFEGNAILLKQWDTAELAETIIKVLSTPSGGSKIPLEIIRYMDRDYNMRLMDSIYRKFLNENPK